MLDLILPVWIQNEATLQLTKDAIFSFGKVNLITVDNNSSLGGGYLREISSLYIRNNQNKGYAVAVNQGLKLAQSNLVAVANNDILVSDGWQDVAKDILTDPTIYSCHFRMVNYQDDFVLGDHVFPVGMERWCTSSFFVVDRSKLKILYDERFINSYDDWDMWLRVRKDGFKTCYTDRACYKHEHSFTQKQVAERDVQNQKNKDYFIEKWGMSAEELFMKEYSDQMAVPYEKGFTV